MEKKCIVCAKSSKEIPLTKFYYKESQFYICPKHIPTLIHKPTELEGLIPDAENFEAV